MCTYLSAMRIFLLPDRESSQYAQVGVGFNRLNFDSDTRSDYWRTFYGSSSEASFCHCIQGKFSNKKKIDMTSFIGRLLVGTVKANWCLEVFLLYNLYVQLIRQQDFMAC